MTVGLGLAITSPTRQHAGLATGTTNETSMIVMFCAHVALLVSAAFFFSVYTEEM